MHDHHHHDHKDHEESKHHTHDHHHHEEDKTGSHDIVKLRKIVEHWIGHNEDHARSYRSWAERAREAGLNEPGTILEEIASQTIDLNQKFMKIISMIDSTDTPD